MTLTSILLTINDRKTTSCAVNLALFHAVSLSFSFLVTSSYVFKRHVLFYYPNTNQFICKFAYNVLKAVDYLRLSYFIPYSKLVPIISK